MVWKTPIFAFFYLCYYVTLSILSPIEYIYKFVETVLRRPSQRDSVSVYKEIFFSSLMWMKLTGLAQSPDLNHIECLWYE